MVVVSFDAVKSPVFADGLISSIVPCPLGVWILVVNLPGMLRPPLRVLPKNPPIPSHTPDVLQKAPAGHNGSPVPQAAPVHRPFTQVRPLMHWPLFVHVDALKVAGVAVHEAGKPEAVKLPLLSAKADAATKTKTTKSTIIFFIIPSEIIDEFF